MKKAYKVGRVVGKKTLYGYRSFETADEAARYCDLVFRGESVRIEETDQYPNSRFANNRPLSIRRVIYA